MQKEYGIAVIGAGDRGTVYSNVFGKIPGTKFISVCDLQEDRTDKVKKTFNFTYTDIDYKKAILRDSVDIVVICTPVCTHHDIAVFAMEHKRHVVMEKSMALSVTDAQDMISTAEKNNVRFTLGFQYPNIKTWKAIKRMIEQNKIGRPILMHFFDYRMIRPKTAMHDALNGNGGPMTDMACHFYDLMHWFFESEPINVTSKPRYRNNFNHWNIDFDPASLSN